ncbi:MAG: hypothetical protein C0424_07210 [Sphingobacteriaceae bacterium]|nr:hypothetical protein [Sphingobacteriaceae bacterium]
MSAAKSREAFADSRFKIQKGFAAPLQWKTIAIAALSGPNLGSKAKSREPRAPAPRASAIRGFGIQKRAAVQLETKKVAKAAPHRG